MFRKIKEFPTRYDKLRYLAYHDALTGLLNRNWLYENKKNINHKYIYFIDINNLHEINKKGHTFGDEHIKYIVNSIQLEDNDIFVRYAGDEFILFSNTKNALYNNELYAVGIAINDEDITRCINNADANMIKSKRKIKRS